MNITQLEQEIEQLRRRPLALLCRDAAGSERTMGVRECAETGGQFIHLVRDDLDALLARELGGEGGPIALLRE